MSYTQATKCIYIDGGVDEQTGSVNPPIYQTAGFAHSDPNQLEKIFKGEDFGYVYSRISNPTVVDLERRVTHLESAFGSIAVSSGLAAVFGVCMTLVESGQNIVVSDSLFGGTRDLFEETAIKLGIHVRFVDFSNLQLLNDHIDEQTAFVFAEIISNPKLIIPNISELKLMTAKFNIPLVIDATLTGAVGFNAKKHGVDVLIYSSTKLFSSNHGAVGGIVIDTGNFDWRKSKNTEISEASHNVHRFAFLERFRRHNIVNAGFNMSPMNAYFTILGIETLSVRYDKICTNALAIAEFFKSIDIAVSYPGLSSYKFKDNVDSFLNGKAGPLLTIDLGSKSDAFAFISKLKIIQNMSNLGDNRTMVIHPLSTIYSKHTDEQLIQAGITEGLVRFSIGIEDKQDLINEIKEALL